MRIVKCFSLLASAALLFAADAALAQTKTVYVPLKFRTVSGVRPFVEVRMGGKPFLLMVHSNATFNLMTTHANAEKAGVRDAVYKDKYGITAPGQVSDLGRAKAVLPKLEIGGRSFDDLAIWVFEVPQDPPMDGMLGVLWLRSSGAILDYDQGRLGLPETPADAKVEDDRLIEAGYVPHKMTYDETSRSYEVRGSIDGHPARLEISTVAENIIDIEFAKNAGIPLGPMTDSYGGPKGAEGPIYLAKRQVDVAIDGQHAVGDRPQILDTYAYDSGTRTGQPDAAHTARLGADFLLANQAVIDFSTNTLFLRPAAPIQASR